MIRFDAEHKGDPKYVGTTYGYRRGCRCAPCKAAKKQDWIDYRKRKSPAPLAEDAMTENIASLYFQGLDPLEVEEVCGLVVHYYSAGVDITDSTLKARAEVLAARVLGA